MLAIGIRTTPTKVHYAVVERGSDGEMVHPPSEIILPIALEVPERLKYLRNTLLDIISEFKIEKAGIRIVEGNSKNKDVLRMNIEGVIQELIASSTIVDYYIGNTSSICSKLNIPNDGELKEIFEGRSSIIDDPKVWKKYPLEKREAIVVALGALNI